ncbi:MAG: hypothetical protein KGJ61_10230, partial [Candidatus Omnitrophica bacterium]|nr:hypothetical protein [Candidatus Omnitrophota bacterium]
MLTQDSKESECWLRLAECWDGAEGRCGTFYATGACSGCIGLCLSVFCLGVASKTMVAMRSRLQKYRKEKGISTRYFFPRD